MASINTRVKYLNTDLNYISLWVTANGLKINRKKSTKIESSIDVFLGGSKIDIVNSARNLGAVFNNMLTWSDHIPKHVEEFIVC